MLIMSTTP